MNVNPAEPVEVQPGLLLTGLQLDAADAQGTDLIFSEGMIQHIAHYIWPGDKYYIGVIDSWPRALWNEFYGGGQARNIQQLLALTAENPQDVNRHAIARIWRVFLVHLVTDTFGDIPYKEAGMGYLGDITRPAYDPQEEIYMDMLKELREATAALDPNMPSYGAQDLIYGGDLEQWKKFGNSLMLRLAMRLTKVAPDLAQQWAQRAYEGGVMTDVDDSAYIMMANGPGAINQNPVARNFESEPPWPTRPFIDALREKGDPRLSRLVAVQKDGVWVSDPAIQKGLPIGHDQGSISLDPYHTTFEDYSRVHPELRGFDDPIFFLMHSEVEFLLAEAAHRNWIQGDAEDFYERGVRSAMQQLAFYGPGAVIPDEEINAYLAAHPFDPSNAFAQLGHEMWVSLFLNGYNAWAHWRRTGYPELIPTNHPDNLTNGQIPRRLLYPQEELTLNGEHYQEAIARQGPDEFMTRVWWDVAQ